MTLNTPLLTSETRKKDQKFINQSVQYIKGVGPSIARLLKRLEIETVEDLLFHFPHRYLDTSKLSPISKVKIGAKTTVMGKVHQIEKIKGRKNISVLNIGIYDGTGYLYGVWFNQDFIADRLKKGTTVSFSGRILYEFGKLQIKNPLFDVIYDETNIDEETVHTNRIVPFHPATQNLSSNRIRRIVKNALDSLDSIDDPIPASVISKYNFLDRVTAVREIHFPSDLLFLKRARLRLLFEELFLLQTGLVLRKKRLEHTLKGLTHKIDGELLKGFYHILPFELTAAQKRVVDEIQNDMAKPFPMNRLLQGEVGSGKTIVALIALLISVQGGYQSAIMAPTEVLALQHYLKIKEMVKPLGIRVEILTGSQSQKQKDELQKEIKEGNVDIVIGTHSLIQKNVEFKSLGLVVIDEQHRFGVRQRVNLKEKGECPDVLIMTATPIPRTLSLTLYGDLDVSVIDELPAGRKPITTKVINHSHRDKAYELIRREIENGRQTYIVCPLIEESDKLEVKAVMEEAERLKNEIFPDLKVSFIHGKLKQSEKEKVMGEFRNGELDILISTSVIEVGVDVPNATVMLIEDAERFGLAQLHQLRGRIGRGEHKSYCILFADLLTEEGKNRMKAIVNCTDGFKLAEADLEIRGEGQLFGPRQSGLPDLKLAKLTKHIKILNHARREAFEIIESDPLLSKEEHQSTLKEIKNKFASSLDWLFNA
ncbi:MAG: ATP-dependent DNA helicase RecG [Actinobacteria bacterium]|nr:ATP-dependent DNA helicase RecG [Actinomycetota bacterium]